MNEGKKTLPRSFKHVVKKQLAIAMIMLLVLSLALSALVFAEGQTDPPATSADQHQDCPQYSKLYNKLTMQQQDIPYITINGNGTATAKFATTEACVEVSFSAYTYEGKPEPYEKQKFFSGATEKYDTPGNKELTIQLPGCGTAQLDLYAGPEQITLNPGYGHNHLTLRNFMLYKTTDCPDPTPTPTPTDEEPTPSQDPTPTPTSEEPTPSQDPTPTPTDGEPTPSQDPTPTPTDGEPTPSQDPTPTPTDGEPTPSQNPTPTPTDGEPTPSQNPTPTPTDGEPTPSQNPTPTPTGDVPTPSPEPTPTLPPTDEPSSSPETSELPPEEPSSEPEQSPLIDIEEEQIPVGSGTDEFIDHAAEETVPLDMLPKTGDTSAIPYYILGSLLTIAGVVTLRGKRRTG